MVPADTQVGYSRPLEQFRMQSSCPGAQKINFHVENVHREGANGLRWIPKSPNEPMYINYARSLWDSRDCRNPRVSEQHNKQECGGSAPAGHSTNRMVDCNGLKSTRKVHQGLMKLYQRALKCRQSASKFIQSAGQSIQVHSHQFKVSKSVYKSSHNDAKSRPKLLQNGCTVEQYQAKVNQSVLESR